ncbi:uncharacterized protein LOC121383892 [Gigantopelta aegis]|uniref:uncharacterized protein LOC121383892 n=1 Tax=Gigantopelta aegis TaxID=1735272 RepID=UPI001B88B652|nr:uncharacterized protein LOC121383892 [Gigantopelta aegis]
MKDNTELQKTIKETYDKTKQIEGITKTLDSEIAEMRVNYDELKERHLDLQSRSMRENLIFTGIPETGPDENTEQLLITFIQKDMEIEQPIGFEHVHRFGKRGYSGPRLIVAKFSKFKDREMVRKASSTKLKGKTFGVNEQFPKEINDRRKELYPYYKQAKRAGKRESLVYDKLYIDGTLYKKDARNTTHEQVDRTNKHRDSEQRNEPRHPVLPRTQLSRTSRQADARTTTEDTVQLGLVHLETFSVTQILSRVMNNAVNTLLTYCP